MEIGLTCHSKADCISRRSGAIGLKIKQEYSIRKDPVRGWNSDLGFAGIAWSPDFWSSSHITWHDPDNS